MKWRDTGNGERRENVKKSKMPEKRTLHHQTKRLLDHLGVNPSEVAHRRGRDDTDERRGL
jgi:hypothetical protein